MQRERWHSERLGGVMELARWGHWGTPVLVFPTAGGDAGEIERHGLVDACSELLDAGRVKLYSCDSPAGRAMLEEWGEPAQRMRLLDAFHGCVRWEVVPAIYADCGGGDPGVLAAGASIGAFNALAMVCRFPEAFSAAVCMSGTYDLQRLYGGHWSGDLHFSSPVHFLPGLDGAQLERLRERFVVLASGEGAWEDIGESWRAADVLGSKGVPNRVDSWGTEWEHGWETWRRMLPTYLAELA
jgi:esterase/lipase superfamily enzyme